LEIRRQYQGKLTILLKMFHYTIAELGKLIGSNETNQSVTQPDPSLTVQVGF
jgi:hypothetical protein